jgi:putative NIF3 family GTP cyclohydrolase 1 type 2
VGRHKAPPSFVEQWLPVGLVIAGVVLAIGFGSYAGRE